jgi:hypothetical protein
MLFIRKQSPRLTYVQDILREYPEIPLPADINFLQGPEIYITDQKLTN